MLFGNVHTTGGKNTFIANGLKTRGINIVTIWTRIYSVFLRIPPQFCCTSWNKNYRNNFFSVLKQCFRSINFRITKHNWVNPKKHAVYWLEEKEITLEFCKNDLFLSTPFLLLFVRFNFLPKQESPTLPISISQQQQQLAPTFLSHGNKNTTRFLDSC